VPQRVERHPEAPPQPPPAVGQAAATAAQRQPGASAQAGWGLNDWPPPGQLALLGAQYAVMAAMYLVLVAIIVRHARASEATGLDTMGIACLGLAIGATLQALPRGPVGSGFLAPPVYSAVYLAPSVLAAERGGLPLVVGMTLFAGVVESVFALALSRLRVIVTPVLTGLTVFVVGLQLGIVGIGETLDVPDEALPSFPLHVATTSLTLAVCIGLSIWGRGLLKMLPTLIGLIVGLLAALAVGLLAALAVGLVGPAQLAVLAAAPWVAVPHPGGLLLPMRFDVGLVPTFLASSVAAGLRAVGVITTCQRINDPDWQRPDMRTIRQGVLADGLSNVIGASLGATGMSLGPSLVGVSRATGATSRAIAFAASAVLVLLALSPRLAGLFLVVPHEVAGSLLVFTASFMIAGGMEIMLSRPTDTRAVYVIGVSTLLALSQNLFPAYFRGLPPVLQSFTNSPLALGLTAAILLTLLFRLGTRQHTRITWSQAEESIAAAVATLADTTRRWKVPENVADLSARHAQEVMRYIAEHHTHDPEGVLDLTYNGVELRVEVGYTGRPTRHLPVAGAAADHGAVELENEEAAAYVGLRTFLRSLSADRVQVKQRGDRVLVRLAYAT
jgi:xanthine permease XanP